MVDQDIIQRLKISGLFVLELYKITTGTLLSLFVPQKCGDNICTVSDNLNNTNPYHLIVLYTNLISMTLFLSYYIIELYREEWCVKNLDVDNNYSDNYLKNIIEKLPNLNKKMDKLNKYYYYSFNLNCFFYVINLSISIKLLNDNYHSSATISSFCSFVLLVLMKMYNSYGVSRISIKDDKMMSAFIKEFISFNVIDKDLLIKKNLDPIEFNKIEFNKIEKKNKDDIEQQDIELVPTEQP
tara:strand:- start:200 stop:919 length:720 start_codon:yes stop_codon:yes gene_type:complete